MEWKVEKSIRQEAPWVENIIPIEEREFSLISVLCLNDSEVAFKIAVLWHTEFSILFLFSPVHLCNTEERI